MYVNQEWRHRLYVNHVAFSVRLIIAILDSSPYTRPGSHHNTSAIRTQTQEILCRYVFLLQESNDGLDNASCGTILNRNVGQKCCGIFAILQVSALKLQCIISISINILLLYCIIHYKVRK